MSGREIDPDGTDSYHTEHPWEQTGHRLYIEPSQRTSLNWPPEPAYPHGPHEAKQWDRLPVRVTPDPSWRRQYGFGTWPPPISVDPQAFKRTDHTGADTRTPLLCKLGLHSWPKYVNAHTQAPAHIRCNRCGTTR